MKVYLQNCTIPKQLMGRKATFTSSRLGPKKTVSNIPEQTEEQKLQEIWFAKRMNEEMEKFLKAPRRTIPEIVAKGDYHVWVVNDKDEIVFDPYFEEYDQCRALCQLTDEMCHEEFSKEDQKLAWGLIKKTKMKSRIDFHKMTTPNKKWWHHYIVPKHRECPYNASAYVMKNKGKKLRIVVGKMGWRRKESAGGQSVWWEYG